MRSQPEETELTDCVGSGCLVSFTIAVTRDLCPYTLYSGHNHAIVVCLASYLSWSYRRSCHQVKLMSVIYMYSVVSMTDVWARFERTLVSHPFLMTCLGLQYQYS